MPFTLSSREACVSDGWIQFKWLVELEVVIDAKAVSRRVTPGGAVGADCGVLTDGASRRDVVVRLEGEHEVAGVKIAIVIPIALFKRRVAHDFVFVLTPLKTQAPSRMNRRTHPGSSHPELLT